MKTVTRPIEDERYYDAEFDRDHCAPTPQETPALRELQALPCPFCGNTPTITHGSIAIYVRCSRRECEATATSFLIAHWNTRYRDPAFQKLVEAGDAIVGWWLREGMHAFSGAPAAIFMLREALDDPHLAREGEE